MPVRPLSAPATTRGPERTDTVPVDRGQERAHPLATARPRAGAVWVGFGLGVLVLVALVVFMLQNTAPVDVAFVGMHGSAPLALMLLIAVVAVAIVALAVGGLRIGPLRRPAPGRRRAGAHAPGEDR